jgi:DnaJ-class molecular chaperone
MPSPIEHMITMSVSCTKCGSKGFGSCNCWIKLECPKCGQRKTTERLAEDHPKATKVMITCPECNGGDFGETMYFDANGKHLIDDFTRNKTA